jgi:hypothetical protein
MTINDFVLAWEVSAGAQSELFVKCPRQAVPSAPLITETPPSGGLLGPQLFYAARAGVMVLAYQTASGFHDVSIEPTTCAATGAPSSVEALDAFGLAITGPLPGVGGSATLGRLFLQKDTAGAHVAAYGALRPTASTTVVRGETGAISGAVGVTDGTGQPLLFYFAADPSGAGPGIVRGAEALVAAWGGSPVTVSRAAVEPDFAVASRQDGGAFVAYRAAGTGTTSAVYVRAIDGSGQGLQP